MEVVKVDAGEKIKTAKRVRIRRVTALTTTIGSHALRCI
jgi:hypothetical protein